MAMVSWLSWLLVIFATCGKVIGVEGDDFLDPFGEFDEFDPESFDDFDTFEGCGNRPMDIVLLVDTSEAYELNNQTYRTIRDFLVKFVKFTNVSSEGTRISLVTYSTSPLVHFRLGEINTPQGVQDAIMSARFMPGERNLADALDALRRRVFFEYYGDRPQVPDMVVLVTTGRSSRRVTQSFQYAQALKDIGVNVIGITWSEGGKQELSSVVSEPAYANLFSLDSISELHIMTELVVAQVCESSDAAYLTPVEGSDDMDLVFLVHFSNELTSTNFAKITSFMADTVEGADIDLDSVRVGVAIYQAEGTVLFKLDAFRGDKSGLIDAIRDISPRYRSGDTNLAAGLNLVRTQMFDVNKGDRLDVPNGLVIITDANSDAQYYPELEYAAALVKDAGVTVFGVGIDLRNTDEMNLVSTNPQMSYVLGNVDQLPSMVQELRQKMPSLTFVLPEDIEPLPTTAAPTTVPTTEATTPAPTSVLESSREADIAVLFHVGHKTKLRDLNKKLKIYLSNLFAKSKVGPDTLRVALANYGTKPNVLFDFNAHTRKPQVRSAIKTTIKGNMRKSRANLGEALSTIRTDLLVPAAGSRIDQGVPTGLILVTDMAASNDGFDFEQEITLLKQMGVTVFGVGIGSSDVHDELRQLTSDPKSDYFQGVQSFSDLLATADPVKNIVNRVRAMGGKIKRRPTTTAPALSKYRKFQLVLVFRSDNTVSTADYYTHLLPFMARFLEEKFIQNIDIEIALISYGDSVNLVFGFQKIQNLTEMQTLILTAPDSLQSNYARFGDVLQYLDLRVFPQVTIDTSKHVVYIADRVYDNMNLKLKNGLLRLARKGIKYHWVLIGGQSNVSTPGDTYLVNDYPSLTHNYDVIDDITTDVSLDDSEYSEALVPKTSESGSLQNPPPTKILIVFRSGSSTSPPDYFTKLLPFISSFIDPNILSEANTDIAVVNYGKDINIVFGFQQLGFDEMRDAVSGISKKYRSKFSRFPLLIEYITQGMLVPPAVADTDDIHVIFIADQLYEKLNSGIRKGIEHLETRGIHTHWVMIGDNSAIPTTSVSYKVADYEELYSRQDITIQILAQITQGWSYTDDDNEVISTPRGPLEPPPEQDDERHVKVVIVFRTGSGTSPKDFYGNLLPFIESFLFETAAVPEVSMDFSVINYGKTVTRIIGFKEYDVEELHGIILGISKKYRSKFARFQDLLLYLQQSVFIPSNVGPDDEKHVIFITDKVYDNMDDSIESGIEDLETSGVMTHWVTIGTDQTIPTRGHVYSTQSYTGLSDYDVFAANFKILADIFTEPGARNHIVTMPTTISPSPTVPLLTTKRTRYAKIVIVFRSGSSTSPKDYFQQLLPFIDTFVNNVYTDQVEAEYSVINYGKTVSQIFGFKDYDPADLQTIILGMTKKYRSKFARFQELLQYLRQSVITQMSDEDEKHIIFITDKIYENMDDEASNALREIENGGVTTHWVLIGHNQDITTRGTKYHVGNYKELSDTSDIPIPYKILTDIQYNRETIHQERTTDRVTTTTAIRTTPQPGGAPDRTSTDPSLADIAFLFHASNTVPKKSFKKGYIKFLLRMIKKFKLEKGKVKTALATYGKNGQLLFNFDAFSQKKPAMKFIRKLPKNLRFKKADLAEGLRLVREQIFVAPFDRPEAPNYLIVLTDSPTDDGVAEVQIEADILKDMGVYVYLITVGDIGEETVIVPSEPSAAKQLSAYTDLANFKKSGKFLTKQIPALKLLKKKKGKGKKKKTTTIAPTSTITTLSTRQSTMTSDISVVTSTVTPVTDTTLDDRMSTDPTTATLPRLTTLMTSSQTSFTSITDAPVTDRTKMTPIDKAITTDAVFSTSGYKKSSEHVPVTKTTPTTIKSTRDVRKTKTTDPTTTQRTIEITDARTAGQTTTILNTVDITSTLGTARSTRSNEIPITQGPPRTTLLPKTTKVPFVSTRFSSASLPERVTSSNDAHTTRTSDMETTTSTQGNRVDEKQTTAATTTAEFTTVKDKASHTTKHHVSTTIAMSTDGFKEMQSVATTVWSRDVRTTLVNKVTTEDDATVAPVALSVSEDADIIIAVHSSITATPSHFTMLLEFLAELYEQADIDGGRVKAGVMFYGSAATPIFYLDQFNSWDEVFMTISRTSNRLRSNVVDASRAMRRASDMFGAARGGRIPKALIMVTDAASNENIDSIPERKEALANQGVSIYSVGVGLPGKEELELLATASDNVFSVIGYEQLPRAAQDIKRRIRSLNTLPERVTDPPEINTSTGSPPAPVRTEAPTSDPGPIRVTFPTPDIGSCGLARVDIVFVIDSSTSVGVENFRKQINFVKQLLSNSDIDSGAVRAGALIYSTGVEVQFHLNDYTSKADMFAAIDDIQYIYGSTNTADGLRTMRQDMFTTANGDRPDVMNIAIVITDGVSNINSRRTIPEAESAHDDGIFIYTIGIGLLDTTELDAIATPPASSNSFVVDSFDELEGFEQKVYKSLCPEERTLPTRRPTTTAKPVTPIPTKPTTPIPTTRAPWTPPPTTTRGISST